MSRRSERGANLWRCCPERPGLLVGNSTQELAPALRRPEHRTDEGTMWRHGWAVMRRGRRTDGRIIECALCADPDEQNAGSRTGPRPSRRREYRAACGPFSSGLPMLASGNGAHVVCSSGPAGGSWCHARGCCERLLRVLVGHFVRRCAALVDWPDSLSNVSDGGGHAAIGTARSMWCSADAAPGGCPARSGCDDA